MFPRVNSSAIAIHNGSIFIGDKGMVTTGCYGERTRLVPAEKMRDYQLPAAIPLPLTRPLPRLDSRSQRRRARVLELQRRRTVCAMDAARRDRDEVRRQADVGYGEDALHEQQSGANEFLKPKFRKGWKFV